MAKAEAELGIRHLQVREHEGLPANLQKLGRGKEGCAYRFKRTYVPAGTLIWGF